MSQDLEAYKERVWRVLCAYVADSDTPREAPVLQRRVARDDDGTPNVYNTIELLKEELVPEKLSEARRGWARLGR